jgi:hypothetical protein
MAPDGTFLQRGEGVTNYVNSAGFAVVLEPDGSMTRLLAMDVNGVVLTVDSSFMITGELHPPPIRRLKASRMWTTHLTYQVTDSKTTAEGKAYVSTIIAGSLAHPEFGENVGAPNMVTGFTGEGASTDTIYHHVRGFPYVLLNEWAYADRDAEEGVAKIVHTRTLPPTSEIALHGKIVGKYPPKATWSKTCESSKYGIMQVGGTCAATACLNLLLCCAPLRHYCIKAMNGFIDAQDLTGLARMAKWNTSRVVVSETLTETILHAMYKRLCGEAVTTPDTVSVTAVCLKQKTTKSGMYCGKGKLLRGLLVLDFLLALGLEKGIMQPGVRKAISGKTFDYALIRANCATRTPGQPCVPLGLYHFSLAGAYISAHYVTKSDPEKRAGHAVAGIVCVDGRRAVFDSNFGEVDIDWVLHPGDVEAYFLSTYGSKLTLFEVIALYFSDAFRDAHAAAVPCMSTVASDKVSIASHGIRDEERLCSLASKLSKSSSSAPISILDGSEVDVRYWRKVPE